MGPVTLTTSVLAFAVVAAALTVTPGLDTALVLRAALTRSRAEALATGAGIVAGLFVWGAAAAVGVSALLAASATAYDVLRWAGAAYLVWVGGRLLVRAVRGTGVPDAGAAPVPTQVWRAARTGLVTNLLNPKVGVFYLALLPQFVPAGSDPLLVGLLLAAVHGVLSLAWFGLLTAVADAAGRWLRRPGAVRAVDGVTGATLVGFGVRLAAGHR
jgi:threonine/homoserine/homoserine lactone efflux protein